MVARRRDGTKESGAPLEGDVTLLPALAIAYYAQPAFGAIAGKRVTFRVPDRGDAAQVQLRRKATQHRARCASACLCLREWCIAICSSIRTSGVQCSPVSAAIDVATVLLRFQWRPSADFSCTEDMLWITGRSGARLQGKARD